MSELASVYNTLHVTQLMRVSSFPADLVDNLLRASYYSYSLSCIVWLQHKEGSSYGDEEDHRNLRWRKAGYSHWEEAFERVFDQEWKTLADVSAI